MLPVVDETDTELLEAEIAPRLVVMVTSLHALTETCEPCSA